MRRFDAQPAKEKPRLIQVGLCGPSGSGKTFTALRLASGIVSVTGGKIVMVDTENERSLHYAGLFSFDVIPFSPPHGSLDYRAAMQAAAKQSQGGVVIVDSMSHEHEGEGGMLDAHDRAVASGAKDPSAWVKPKADRRKLLQALVQLGAHVVCCWRAQSKRDWSATQERDERGRKKPPRERGLLPIGDEAWIYEMTASILLREGCDGAPCEGETVDEKRWIKVPGEWRHFVKPGEQLTEDHGAAMGRWARLLRADATQRQAVTEPLPLHASALAEELGALSTQAELDAWAAEHRDLDKEVKQLLAPAWGMAQARITHKTVIL